MFSQATVLAIFAIFLAQSFHMTRKILVIFAIFAKFADFSKPFLTFSLCQCRICLICSSCYFCHICCSVFSRSEKNSCYFCNFCEICYFFYTSLIVVFFKCFLLKLRKQFARKFLPTTSILDISDAKGNLFVFVLAAPACSKRSVGGDGI